MSFACRAADNYTFHTVRDLVLDVLIICLIVDVAILLVGCLNPWFYLTVKARFSGYREMTQK